MGKDFLKIYVGINILVIVFNVISNIFSDEVIQILSKDDWLIFIIACGALAISEALEEKYGT